MSLMDWDTEGTLGSLCSSVLCVMSQSRVGLGLFMLPTQSSALNLPLDLPGHLWGAQRTGLGGGITPSFIP